MKKIYFPQLTEDCQSIVHPNTAEWIDVFTMLNFKSLRDTWDPPHLEFDRSSKSRPDITNIFTTGVLAFRADFLNKIFPVKMDGYEFLPAYVSDEEWIILNCLNFVSKYDKSRSDLTCISENEIILISRVCITDSVALDYNLFTLKNSGRGQLLASSEFMDRVSALGGRGLEFRPAGEVDF